MRDLKMKNLLSKIKKADHTLAAQSEVRVVFDRSNVRSCLNISSGHCSVSKVFFCVCVFACKCGPCDESLTVQGVL
jgi:hypothetical protein